jgi:hypothetical protein
MHSRAYVYARVAWKETSDGKLQKYTGHPSPPNSEKVGTWWAPFADGEVPRKPSGKALVGPFRLRRSPTQASEVGGDFVVATVVGEGEGLGFHVAGADRNLERVQG